jgi:hypothetical protein
MMAADPDTADLVKLMYEMYGNQQASFGDIARYFAENNIDFNGGSVHRATLSIMLRNPVYVQADLEVYEFFKSQGATIVNDAADFTGTNGCYLYQGRDVEESKYRTFKDHILVIAPHEGVIPSETWLACRKRLMTNTAFGGDRKAKNTWLAGKIKCGKCGAGLSTRTNGASIAYFRCRRRAENKGCEGCGKLRARDTEDFIYSEMRRKMADFQTLTGGNPAKTNPKITALNVELAQVEAEIEKLINTLTGANQTLMNYANVKIVELDGQRQTLMKQIADMTAETVSPEKIKSISGHLENWDNISFDDRRLVADGLISIINATSESVQIQWKI